MNPATWWLIVPYIAAIILWLGCLVLWLTSTYEHGHRRQISIPAEIRLLILMQTAQVMMVIICLVVLTEVWR